VGYGGSEGLSELTLRFDRFGCRKVYEAAFRQGRGLDTILADALANLEAAIEGRRLAAAPPSFLADRAPGETSIRLHTPSSRLQRLRPEARRRQVPLERLVEHALLLYLADGQAGRIATPGRPRENGDRPFRSASRT
jgi:hypothetical protein